MWIWKNFTLYFATCYTFLLRTVMDAAVGRVSE